MRIVVICVALPFVLPDVHKVVAPIQSADPLFLGQITNRVVTASFGADAAPSAIPKKAAPAKRADIRSTRRDSPIQND